MKDYSETHARGLISFDQNAEIKTFEGDLGIQIKGGRVWICIDGVSLIRFRPIDNKVKGQMKG